MIETSESRWARHNEAGRKFFSQGDLAGAEAEFIAAVREAKALGGDGLQLATSLGSLGQLRYRQRDFAQAEKLFKHALVLREQVLGADHPSIVQGLNNLAALHYARGESGQAERLFRRAIQINEKHLGPRHPDLDVNLNNLAKLYVRMRDFAAAQPLLQRLLSLREEVKGSGHREVAAVLVMLARARLVLGAHHDAEVHCLRALSIYEAVLPTGDATLLSTHKLLDEIAAVRRAAAGPPAEAPSVSLASVREPEPPLEQAPAPIPEPSPEPPVMASLPTYEPELLAPAPRPVPMPKERAPVAPLRETSPDAPADDTASTSARPQFVPPPSWRSIHASFEESPPASARDDWSMDHRDVAGMPDPPSGVAPSDPEPLVPAGAGANASADEGVAPAAPQRARSSAGLPESDQDADDEGMALIEEKLRARRRRHRAPIWRGVGAHLRSVGLAAAGLLVVLSTAYFVVGRGGDAAAGVPPVDSAAVEPARPAPVLGDFDRRLPSRSPDDARTTRSDAAISDRAGEHGDPNALDDFLIYEDSIVPLPTLRIQVEGVSRSIARTKARVDSLGREIPQEPIQFQRRPSRGP